MSRAYRLVAQLKTSAFIRHNTILFVGSLLIGLINYLFYPILSRILQPHTFGEVQTMSSLFLQIAIFLNVLGLLTVNIVANYLDADRRNRMIAELERLAIFVVAGFVLVAVLVSGLLQRFFHFDSPMPFVMLALAIFACVPITFRNGFLRGKKRFGLVVSAGIIGAVSYLLLAIILALMHFGTTGIMVALMMAQVITLGYAAWRARQQGFTDSLRGNMFRFPDLKLILPELKYALLILAGSLAITAMYTLDIIVVKHYFDAHTAGLYAGIATVARIILFLTGSVTQALLPAVKLNQVPGANRRILLKSFVLLTTIGGAALLIFMLFPQFVMRLLLGSTYVAYADLLPRLGLALFVISLLNLFITYFMALRRYAIGFIMVGGVAITLFILYINHASLGAVINSLLYGSLLMLSMMGAWALFDNLKQSRLKGGV